ncbi:rhamnose ABC transporter substrate-binding protein [Streptomyces sp. NPDC090080]|uniref:rhamnose ABC transporter substrate-binding protein n=1 Tax=Streptomyces sp. NPDC090080 TaxID=3365939 RepID=UPI00382AE4A4
MHQITSRRTGLALALALPLTLLATACGEGNSNPGPQKPTNPTTAERAYPLNSIRKNLTVAFVPKQKGGNLYLEAASKGGKSVVSKLGSSFQEVGTSDSTDVSGQADYISQLTNQGVDAIAVSAQDPTALCSALKRAMGKGIAVITYDSDTRPECRNAFISPADTDELTFTLVQSLAQQINYNGDIAILSAGQNATNQNTWIKSMREDLATDPRYTRIRLVTIAYGDDKDDKSYQLTGELLKKYPNLKGIISPTTIGIKAAARYLSQSPEYKGKVKLTGLGTPNDMRPYVKDGTVQSFELWDPTELGKLAAWTAVSLASNKITGREGQAFKAVGGQFFTLKTNGVINLGEPTVFTIKNIDDYNF